jgi:hypothetical protein
MSTQINKGETMQNKQQHSKWMPDMYEIVGGVIVALVFIGYWYSN